MLSCRNCGASNYHFRHENIVYAVATTLRHHGIYAKPNPPDMPIPGSDKGGPDILVIANSQPYVLDVTVHCDPPNNDAIYAANQRLSRKQIKYKPLTSNSSFKCIPFVCSIHGEIHHSVRHFAQQLAVFAHSESLVYDLFNNVRIALLKGLFHGFDLLHAFSAHRTSSNVSKNSLAPNTPSALDDSNAIATSLAASRSQSSR